MEADLRHAELIIKQLGLDEAKPLSNPSAEEVKRPDDEVELNAEYSTQYKSIVARANYLAADRPDIQYAVKTLATSMAKPTHADWQKLKRLGRYLKGKPRLVIKYDWQTVCSRVTANSDSDWAGDKVDRKSCHCGVFRAGGAAIAEGAHGQNVLALSSGEAEYYGGCSAGAHGIHLKRVMEFLRIPKPALLS